ncbi:MAG TPA: GDP-L-fucose synthase [Alphaproteobacteria bacterium]|nr:GDP-L-fucose synthase [Alphaproteobacteria bacterium]
MHPSSRIYVAGHRGLVGSAIVRKLGALGYSDLVVRPRSELDLTRQSAVEAFFASERPEVVFLAAARVGGIVANDSRPADFIRDNLAIQTNVIEAARRSGARKLLFLGSSCIYPRLAPQPIREESLLTGPLEPTNEAYAIAKIAGYMMCRAYWRQHGFKAISLMPTNLYGPHDNFDPTGSHVVPGLMRRFHEAKLAGAPEVAVWGSGTPRRELLHVDDLADAAVMLMNTYDSPDIINVGTGEDATIADIAAAVKNAVGYRGRIVFDRSKPDGTPRKVLDVSRITALGWRPKIAFADGLGETYRWFVANVADRAA